MNRAIYKAEGGLAGGLAPRMNVLMSMIIWLNGTLLPLEKARVSPLDQGFLVGDGVFETLVARGGFLYAVHEHWERLVQSCEALDLEAVTGDEFVFILKTVLQANNLNEARLRFTITRGDSSMAAGQEGCTTTILATAVPLKPWPSSERVCLAPWTRNQTGALTGVKTTSYGENVRALSYARKRDCGEALMANTRGDLCEGTGSNVFLVLNGKLVTPPLASGCLAGVTRRLVLEACEISGISCHEESVLVSSLNECEEAFLTSSTRGVHPIYIVDKRTLQVTGGVTQKVQKAFIHLAEKKKIAANLCH